MTMALSPFLRRDLRIDERGEIVDGFSAVESIVAIFELRASFKRRSIVVVIDVRTRGCLWGLEVGVQVEMHATGILLGEVNNIEESSSAG